MEKFKFIVTGIFLSVLFYGFVWFGAAICQILGGN